eukprot:m.291865 g.291865  ORF g.291865 m.291865 type:complete len:369 (+) comp12528_c0_seq1:227-1333(+)
MTMGSGRSLWRHSSQRVWLKSHFPSSGTLAMDLALRRQRMLKSRLLFLAWNQEFGCFVCGLENGFRVFRADPLVPKATHEFEDGGIGSAEMLYRCNYVALVGGGRVPKYSTNKVVLWNEATQEVVFELAFKSQVKAVRLRHDRLIVVLATRVHVYTLEQPPQPLAVFQTCDNPRGLAAFCADPDHSPILACPGPAPGQVNIINVGQDKAVPSVISAHETSLSCISLNPDGSLLATASEKGTLIRIFDVASGAKLHELRRGSQRATINSINFNIPSDMVCVSSDKGTIHVFRLNEEQKPGTAIDSFMPSYFKSHWSFFKFSVTSPLSICAFHPRQPQIMVACADGNFVTATFNDKGECKTTSRYFLAQS